MSTHPFWGNVAEDWAGLGAERRVSLPGFAQPIQIFLGEELFEEDEDYHISAAQLDEYAATFQAFEAGAPLLLADLREQAFARYRELYAHYYEDAAASGEPPLLITTADQHLAYLQSVSMLRVSDEQTVRLVIHYDLDSEHGLEAKFVNNTLTDLGGIADT